MSKGSISCSEFDYYLVTNMFLLSRSVGELVGAGDNTEEQRDENSKECLHC